MTERRAVVVGAGMAGLLAARVLADRMDQVTIVDRDPQAGSSEPRKGVPQGRHAHGLLPSGEKVIRSLFPGLAEQLVSGGAQVATTTQCRWWQYGGYRIESPAPDAMFLSRPYLEHGVLTRVTSLPGVTVAHARIRGLAMNDGRVVGVLSENEDKTSTIPADLVVDASGRFSAAPRWLHDNGFPKPPMAEIQIDMGYATRLYRRSPGRLPDGRWIVTIGDPLNSKRLAVAFPIEDDRWIVTLAGMHGDHAPTDDAGFATWAETLPTRDVSDIISHEEPVGPVVTHRMASDQWRHFERVRRHPAGFLAIGDSICSFNPVYGQGMSSAAQQAVVLAGCLDRIDVGSPKLPSAFYRGAAKVIARPWGIAAGGDFCFAETTGAKPPMVDGLNGYVKKAVVAAQHDPVVAQGLWDVQGLLAPPPALLKPRLVVRVLRGSRKGPTGQPATMVGNAAPTALGS